MTKKNSIIIFLFALGSYSCKKDHNPAPNPAVDIYIAGTVNGSAAYWKNDSLVYLTDGSKPGVANSILVSGNDVYVAGMENRKAKYWKNGVEGLALKPNTPFPSGAKSIAVSGNDVLIAGYGSVFSFLSGIHQVGRLWKNDSLVDAETYVYSDYLASIIISGKDIYTTGSSAGVAMYYKNGDAVMLTDGTMYAYGNSLAVEGNDVYVAGAQEISVNGYPDIRIATYWKNGNLVTLTNASTEDGITTSIAVSGNNVYVAGVQYEGSSVGGYANGVAKYWKNGVSINLTGGSTDDEANSIAVSGTEVYVAGKVNGLSTYWKNGKAINLSNVPSVANCIFLSKK